MFLFRPALYVHRFGLKRLQPVHKAVWVVPRSRTGTDSNAKTVLALTWCSCAGCNTGRVLWNEGRDPEAQAGRLGSGALGHEEGPRGQGGGDCSGTCDCNEPKGEPVRGKAHPGGGERGPHLRVVKMTQACMNLGGGSVTALFRNAEAVQKYTVAVGFLAGL